MSSVIVANSQSQDLESFQDLDIDRKWYIPHWFALFTRSRHEKFADQELRKKGIQAFLPLRKITRQWSDRRKIVEEPLFKGYLFVHIPLFDRMKVLNTKGVVHFVGSSEKPVEVPEQELWAVRRFVEEEIQIDPYPYLEVGEFVRVRSGSFKGVEGFIVRKDKHCRLVISFDIIMKSISIELDESCVEPI